MAIIFCSYKQQTLQYSHEVESFRKLITWTYNLHFSSCDFRRVLSTCTDFFGDGVADNDNLYEKSGNCSIHWMCKPCNILWGDLIWFEAYLIGFIVIISTSVNYVSLCLFHSGWNFIFHESKFFFLFWIHYKNPYSYKFASFYYFFHFFSIWLPPIPFWKVQSCPTTTTKICFLYRFCLYVFKYSWQASRKIEVRINRICSMHGRACGG